MQICLRLLGLLMWGAVLALGGCTVTAPQPTASMAPAGGTAQVAPSSPLLSQVTRTAVLAAADGIEVAVVYLRDQRALVRVTGLEHELDGMVLMHQIESDGPYTRYLTQLHGRPLATVVKELRYSRITWRLYVPGKFRDGAPLRLEEKKQVEVGPLIALHQQQQRDGQLGALQRFDRPAEQQRLAAELALLGEELARDCGQKIDITVDWSTVSDEMIKSHSLASYCGTAYEALRKICPFQAGKALIKPITAISCVLGTKVDPALKGNTMLYRISLQATNLAQRALEFLHRQPTATGKTLGQLVEMERTAVCRDAKSGKVLILAPHHTTHAGVAYGDGKQFTLAAAWPMLSSGWFFDPRQFNPRNSTNFRGHDLRFYSRLEVDQQQQRCTLVCGERRHPLEVVALAQALPILSQAAYQPSPHQRQPYALARNRQGVYYYVDRGSTAETRRDFQVYIGRRGRLKKQPMKDIVSDSEGEIFSTRNGTLRLVLGQAQALWIHGKQKATLLWIPVQENFPLIYNELGVYLGQRLGLPCDDY